MVGVAVMCCTGSHTICWEQLKKWRQDVGEYKDCRKAACMRSLETGVHVLAIVTPTPHYVIHNRILLSDIILYLYIQSTRYDILQATTTNIL